ncbi:molybdate ABC transporter substrate-binding protein [Fictibacillus phosphorivorans]|uniref:Molybdate ABC transporter substrate-binding protein n=1 Tax=Fictibacillus phosphorivorans TaxID=1221500 RepID=A0A168W7H7_9BACL|nr:molybdate ABC transporter substrate-binding protein [Fictibacillus phosphorivorans]ANC78349.1 molybdate ABC transporter substrate-binding protein [Fictibacillus phosphorivorans]
MRRNFVILLLLCLFVTLLSACSKNETSKLADNSDNASNKENVELTISAAASLQDVLNKLATQYENEHPNISITYNFGGSGALQQQISNGAPVDLFFSAAEDKFDLLVEEGFIEKNKGTDLVGNELVLVVGKDQAQNIRAFEDLPKIKKMAIGTPETVPAGKYAVETLERSNLLKEVEQQIVYAKDVRQVLTYVETGNVDAGIVYKTDAMISSKVKIAAVAKYNTHSPIIYPVGIIKGTSHKKEAEKFYNYLQKEESLKTFEKFGFHKVKK